MNRWLPKDTVMMQVRLLLFASHRELLGERQLELEVPEETTAEDLYALIEKREPAMSSLRTYTSFAVNREMVDPSTRLQPGDEVAFLQPSSGGAG